jgi:Predicted nucleotide-binding protein containing TIR-like domain
MPNKPRVYISVADDHHFTNEQRSLKNAILQAIGDQGFELQVFLQMGLPAKQAWSFQNANNLMSRCHGAAVLAFAKWRHAQQLNGAIADLPSEYNHFEGALAIAHDVPVLLVTDRTVKTAGITYLGGGMRVHLWPDDRGVEWVRSDDFRRHLLAWADEVMSRRRIFLGYCSRAKPTADALTLYIERELGAKVLNYSMDFRPGQSILEQIENAAKECVCGVFLFTKDDEIAGAETQAAPRDNVIFEAGYFTRAKGKERVLIIREEGTKMPADLRGVVYIWLKNREEIAPIETQIRRFLDDRL